MAKYPERPKRKSGYSDEWIKAYLAAEVKAKDINKFNKAIQGKEKEERREIFISMFIEQPTFDDEVKKILKDKRAQERANKAQSTAKSRTGSARKAIKSNV